MCKTRRGVYHNLDKSEYATSNGEVALFFSSKFYLGKFLDEYHDNRVTFRDRIERAMLVDSMNTDLLADINLYKEIEKRGFRSNVKGVEMNWQELLKYVLWNVTLKNTGDWYETSVQKLEGSNKTTV